MICTFQNEIVNDANPARLVGMHLRYQLSLLLAVVHQVYAHPAQGQPKTPEAHVALCLRDGRNMADRYRREAAAFTKSNAAATDATSLAAELERFVNYYTRELETFKSRCITPPELQITRKTSPAILREDYPDIIGHTPLQRCSGFLWSDYVHVRTSSKSARRPIGPRWWRMSRVKATQPRLRFAKSHGKFQIINTATAHALDRRHAGGLVAATYNQNTTPVAKSLKNGGRPSATKRPPLPSRFPIGPRKTGGMG